MTTWCLGFFKVTSNLNALIIKNSIDTNKIVKDVSVTCDLEQQFDSFTYRLQKLTV